MLPLVAQERPKRIRWRILPPAQITANSSRSERFCGDTKQDTVKGSGNAAFYIPQNQRGGEKGHEERLEKSIRDHGRKNPVCLSRG